MVEIVKINHQFGIAYYEDLTPPTNTMAMVELYFWCDKRLAHVSSWLNVDINISSTLLLSAAGTLYGPMHTKVGVEAYQKAVADAQAQGGKVEYGGKVLNSPLFYC